MLRRPGLSILSAVYNLVAEDDSEVRDLNSKMRLKQIALVVVATFVSTPLCTGLISPGGYRCFTLGWWRVRSSSYNGGGGGDLFKTRSEGLVVGGSVKSGGVGNDFEEQHKPKMSPMVRSVVTRNQSSLGLHRREPINLLHPKRHSQTMVINRNFQLGHHNFLLHHRREDQIRQIRGSRKAHFSGWLDKRLPRR